MADESKFTVIMKRSPDYKIYPGSGVFGSPTPDGKGILMNFCVDHAAFPNYIQYAIVEGKIDSSKIVDQARMGEVEREILCGISMSVEQARGLVSWLKRTIATIEGKQHE